MMGAEDVSGCEILLKLFYLLGGYDLWKILKTKVINFAPVIILMFFYFIDIIPQLPINIIADPFYQQLDKHVIFHYEILDGWNSSMY